MDFGKSGQITAIKPWIGSDDTFAIRWYKAAPTAKLFPFRTAFAALWWEDNRFDYTAGPGPVPQPYLQPIRSPAVIPPGEHFHGPAEWYLGIPPEGRNVHLPNCVPLDDFCLLTDAGDEILTDQGPGCIEIDH